LDSSNHPEGFKDDSNGITDAENDYAYDDFGNLKKDQNKQITSITYNHLNLPTSIEFADGRNITYLYNAVGQKVKKVVQRRPNVLNFVKTDYMDGFQYTDDILRFFPHAEGYVNAIKNQNGSLEFNYVYQYKDHLGNVRLSFAENPSPDIENPSLVTILEENHYYPFGLEHTSYNTSLYDFVEVEDGNDYYINLAPVSGDNLAYKYRYNSKEYQDELGLNVYDYGGRIYAPDAPRFWQIDPKAEKYYSISPTVYVADNPVNAIDPTGEEIIFIVRGETRKQDQSFTYRKGNFYNNATGKRYNPGKESLSPTMYKVLSAYRQIEKSDNGKLKTVLHQLEKSKLKHYVEDGAKVGQDNHVEAYGIPAGPNKNDPSGTRTYYNFSEEENKDFEETEGVPNSVESTVAHEMRHQYDHDIGNMGDNSDTNDENDPAEIRAVFFENLMRRTLKQLERKEYGEPIDSKKLKDPPNNVFK
jgi:RHS repeat-associated protein